MSFLDGFRHRLRVFGRPRSYERELDEELRFHLSLEAMQQEHAAHGTLSPPDARFRARRRFGNPTFHKEETRAMSGLGFFDMARQDLRFALRTLRRTPGFTAIAILTLALGIGANTAIFSAVDAMLLRPLPYRQPDRLMQVSITVPSFNGQPESDDVPWSYLKAAAFRDAQHVFSSVGLYSRESVTLRATDATREESEVIDEGYLPTLGLSPSLGRNFVTDENRPNGRRSVIVSESFWNRRLNADPSVLGRTLDIEGAPFTVIGVMAAGFHGLGGRADLWMTIGTRRPFMFDPNEAWDHEFTMVGRLAPGISPARAKSDAAVLGARANAAFATGGPGPSWAATARPLDGLRVDPLMRRSLLVLLGAVAFVLLIACANLANLFLARASARQREIAVRLAIGASRRRLVRQLLTESLLLSVLGGLASVAVASLGVRTLSTLNPERAFPAQRIGGLGAVNFSTIQLDWRALVFAAGAALVTGILFGLVPATQATRPSLTAALKDGSPHTSLRGILRRVTTRNLLVVVELALALVLLAGSGVMLRSLAHLLSVDPGFDAGGVLTLRLNSTPQARPRDSLPAFYHTLIAQLRAIPGVTDAALGDCPPLAGGCNSTMISRHGGIPLTLGSEPLVGVHWVTPGWFATLRVPLVSGRLFTDADRVGGPKVVLVNATAARRFWPNESPIGKRVGLGQGGFDTATVVGVVGDVHFGTIDSTPGADAFIPYAQSPRNGALVYLRTAGDPALLASAARRVIHDVGADLPVYDVRTLASRVGDASAQARFSSLLILMFAGAALVLATVGIYGVISFAVAQRTREIGIRIALGADRGSVLRLVVSQGAALTTIGLVLGLGTALVTTRVLRSLLFEVTPSDPVTYGLVVVVLAVSALAASWVPARRAAALQPTAALRE
ncbi:MAG TPA: ABC transporter permease [Gemmatimonadaceae bacterium]|nr:ABC transporter permease [Gemmatimonadaceae bacterium]